MRHATSRGSQSLTAGSGVSVERSSNGHRARRAIPGVARGTRSLGRSAPNPKVSPNALPEPTSCSRAKAGTICADLSTVWIGPAYRRLQRSPVPQSSEPEFCAGGFTGTSSETSCAPPARSLGRGWIAGLSGDHLSSV